ncbi:unnamed protein product [Ambrosiozyma monospora]|uniref:Unnamed protein product n=1 Tax=Ambrosiozyma monospora TaxID=43982 RepID=A0ACB5TBT3_AMBMO|nr:unnamed protein product [Ambrosiozyma monospora]
MLSTEAAPIANPTPTFKPTTTPVPAGAPTNWQTLKPTTSLAASLAFTYLKGTYGIVLEPITDASSDSVTSKAKPTTPATTKAKDEKKENEDKDKKDDKESNDEKNNDEDEKDKDHKKDKRFPSTTSTTASASKSTTLNIQTQCKVDGAVHLTLSDSILKDELDRIGCIVANKQFQFDGPPQAGVIYAAGWAADSHGYLYIGDSRVFYKCSSGNFYNVYSEDINKGACIPISIRLVSLVEC